MMSESQIANSSSSSNAFSVSSSVDEDNDVEMNDVILYSVPSSSAAAAVSSSSSSSLLSSSSSSSFFHSFPSAWIAHPFNFFVFPTDGINCVFGCESEAIAFNRDHGMNFNKW
jgi:CAF1 family ribonuclease